MTGSGVDVNQPHRPGFDYEITDDLTVNLRARSTYSAQSVPPVSGYDRVYTVELTCDDIFGNVVTTTVDVPVVP